VHLDTGLAFLSEAIYFTPKFDYMRTSLVLIFLILSLISVAQKEKVIFPTDSSGDIVFTEVVKLDSVSSSELFSRAKAFVAEAYKSSKDVTQLNDDQTKTVIIKPAVKVFMRSMIGSGLPWGYVTYQLKVECKDNRYRYTINGLYHHGEITNKGQDPDGGALNQEKSRSLNRKAWEDIKLQVYNEITNVLLPQMKRMLATASADF
jgi:hypothetical protein